MRINVGENLDCNELLDVLRNHNSDLESFLVDRLEYLSVRAVCDDFDLAGVESDGGSKFILRYAFDWSAHYGCRDANDGGSEESKISFTYGNGVATFEKEVVSPRFPNEEF